MLKTAAVHRTYIETTQVSENNYNCCENDEVLTLYIHEQPVLLTSTTADRILLNSHGNSQKLYRCLTYLTYIKKASARLSRV